MKVYSMSFYLENHLTSKMNVSTGIKYIPRIRSWSKNASRKIHSVTGIKLNSIEAANLNSIIRNQFSTIVRGQNCKYFLVCQNARPSLSNDSFNKIVH